jgi:hypothetical protein
MERITMIQHAWTVVCEKSVIDKDTNNISLDVLEQLNINVPTIPSDAEGVIFPVRMEIVSLWYRTSDENISKAEGRVRIEASTGEAVVSADIGIDFSKSSRYRTRARLGGLPIPKDSSGNYYTIVELKVDGKWVEVSKVPLEVNLQQVKS